MYRGTYPVPRPRREGQIVAAVGTRIIGYTRVSTEEQAASGYGLRSQENQIRATVERREWALVDVFSDEGKSGRTLDRPGLNQALQLIADDKADGLVVAKLDRVSRSVVDFGLLLDWFTEAGAIFLALDLNVDTSSPGGRLVANVFASVAEWERDTIAQRTKDGLAVVRAEGRPIGPGAVSDQPELAMHIQSMRDEGISLRGICDRLNAEGVPTPRGGSTWRPSSLQTILGYRRRRKPRTAASLPELR